MPGTYTYTVTEAKGDAACAYDASSYVLTYAVTDDGQGRLRATRTMTKTSDGTTTEVNLGADGSAVGAVFTNVYPEPSSPETPGEPSKPQQTATKRGGAKLLPQTGDNNVSGMQAMLALLGCGGVALGFALRWRRGSSR